MIEKLETGNILVNIFKNNWDEVFVFDAINEQVFSYRDLFEAILNCVDILENKGFTKNDTICLLMTNSMELLILYFASLLMQATLVPIDPKKGESEIRELLTQFEFKGVLTNSYEICLENECTLCIS